MPTYCMIFVGLIASYIYLTDGKNNNEFLRSCMQVLKYPNSYKNGKGITFQISANTTNKPIGLLWGDSYAGHLAPLVENVLTKNNVFIFRSVARCFPSLTINSMLECDPKKCRQQRQDCISEIASNNYDVIFLAGDWGCIYTRNKEQGFNAIIETIDFCAMHAKLVYFFAAPIYYKNHVSNIFMRSQISSLYPQQIIRDDGLQQKINNKFKQAIVAKNYNNVYFVDRDILYGSINHQDFTNDGLPYTFDNGHLSIAGSIAFAINFMNSKLFLPLKQLLELRP